MGIAHDWGSAEEERRRTYPCDASLPEPTGVCFRAVLRVAPYSYDWIDNFGASSPRIRDPRNEQLIVGQTMMRVFELVEFERDRHLTMIVSKTGLFGGVAMPYQVDPRPAGSRIVVKFLFRTSAPMRWLLPPGDLVMMRKQLLTLKELAENDGRDTRVPSPEFRR